MISIFTFAVSANSSLTSSILPERVYFHGSTILSEMPNRSASMSRRAMPMSSPSHGSVILDKTKHPVERTGRAIRKTHSLLWACLIASVLLAGCTSADFVRRKTFSINCAWCRRTISRKEFTLTDDHKVMFVSKRSFGTVYHRTLGQAQDYAGERRMIQQYLAQNVPCRDGGHPFCSLRCLNSYKASTDIKEDRRRIIIGE
jgi:hypothetical protein